MAFFAVTNRQSSQMALTIAANRGHRKQKSFYRTSRISGFSAVRATNTTVPTPSLREFASIASTKPKSTFAASTELFNSSGVSFDLLERTCSGETEPTISISPEDLERAAWFSSLSGDEVSDEDENDEYTVEDCDITEERKVGMKKETSFGSDSPTRLIMGSIERNNSSEFVLEKTVCEDCETKFDHTSSPEVSLNSVKDVEVDSICYGHIGPEGLEEGVILEREFGIEDSQVFEINSPKPTDKPVPKEPEDRDNDSGGESEEEDDEVEVSKQEISEAINQVEEGVQEEEETGRLHAETSRVGGMNEWVDEDQQAQWSQFETQQMLANQICDNLTVEIENMVQWIDEQHENSAFVRHENSRLLSACVKATLGDGVNVVEYGSSAANLALPDSDLDYVVVLEKRSNAFTLTRNQQLDYLEKVYEALSVETWVQHLTFVKTAGIPVIKFKGIGERPIDLSCLGLHHHGLRTQHLLQDQLSAKPHLRALVLVLKQLVKDHELTASGGISSYALFLVTACFLSWHHLMMQNMDTSHVSLGWILLAFLEQHSAVLDYRALVFTVNGYEPRTMDWAHFSQDIMAVLDPFDDQRNVTRGLYRVSHFTGTLRTSWMALNKGESLSSILNTRPTSTVASTNTSWKQKHISRCGVSECSDWESPP
mmetsp:Transcript_9625/g.12633  ORF Transcript_9625/g.12633 Transcript_9625/m.12633 type:complete len:655 (+) Transcript_9625:28-1992(+)